jgi:phage baseplate assembly protein W
MVYTISTEDKNIEWGLTGKDRIVQNVLNLLRTKKYEVPFMREIGIDTDNIDNASTYVCNNITNEILALVEKYEPSVTILNVIVNGQDDNGNLIIEVEMEV